MPADASEMELHERITELEREVVDLRHRIRPAPVPSVSGERLHALKVRVARDHYAIPIHTIRQVVPMVWPKPLPQAADWVLGTFRYGRHVVPMVDLHRRLAGERPELDVSWRIIVAFVPAAVGLVVTEIGEILDVPAADVAPPAADIRQAPFLAGALAPDDGEIVYVLSIERLARETGVDA